MSTLLKLTFASQNKYLFLKIDISIKPVCYDFFMMSTSAMGIQDENLKPNPLLGNKKQLSEVPNQREQYLKRRRERKKQCRKELKELASRNDKRALGKVANIKEQKRKQYLKNKTNGKCKEWDNKRRKTKLWTYIKKNLYTGTNTVNGSQVLCNKEKVTPLVAVIKQGDFIAVRALLGMKASPSISWKEKGHWILPLEEAVQLGHEKIARLLLDNGACKEKGWCFGSLHGAIAKKMFALVKLLIDKGASLDSTYVGSTPLCAALTCGKKGTGDIRIVRLLLNAKADLKKKTTGPRSSTQKGLLTHLEVAKKFSNAKCLALISEMYKQ